MIKHYLRVPLTTQRQRQSNTRFHFLTILQTILFNALFLQVDVWK